MSGPTRRFTLGFACELAPEPLRALFARPEVMRGLLRASAVVTLAIPGMILNETVLSFLGLGLRDPAISWGVLLQDAQNVQTVSLSPWLLLPVAPVILIILCFNFFGDGLRDAADPYGR